jgi:SAM-dependent methyltransferase
MNIISRLRGLNASRDRLLSENAAFAEQVPGGALVLDAGAGNAPYRNLFRHARYESADFEKIDKSYAVSTYVCDLRDIPVEDGRFDFVVFNQVMEHLPEPKLVLEELNRVLKPGGRMIYSGPLFYEEHEQPYDFFRYTQFGLRHLFSTTGFAIERLDWLEGYFGTAAYQLNRMFHYLPAAPRDLGGGIAGYALVPIMMLLKIGFAGCSLLFHGLEGRVKYQAKGYPTNYVAIVRKMPPQETR